MAVRVAGADDVRRIADKFMATIPAQQAAETLADQGFSGSVGPRHSVYCCVMIAVFELPFCDTVAVCPKPACVIEAKFCCAREAPFPTWLIVAR